MCFYHHGEQEFLWEFTTLLGRAGGHPYTQTQQAEQLPVPPTQGKPSTGDKLVLLTHTKQMNDLILSVWNEHGDRA